MARTALIEGILLLAISLVGMLEGMRLIGQKDSQIIYDPLGPGYYIFFLSIALMVTGLIHLMVNYRKNIRLKKVLVDKAMRVLVIKMGLVMVLYTVLIDLTGYLIATIVFFFLEFRIMGIKSWLTNGILTVALSAAFYIIFVQHCSMVFREGIFFR